MLRSYIRVSEFEASFSAAVATRSNSLLTPSVRLILWADAQ